jgi:hypothetical protein
MDEEEEESWHYLRTCETCGGRWYGLHCPHDGHQNPCLYCGTRPEPNWIACDCEFDPYGHEYDPFTDKEDRPGRGEGGSRA